MVAMGQDWGKGSGFGGGGSGSGCDQVALAAGQLGAGQASLSSLRPLSTLASLHFPTAWLPQGSPTAYTVAEAFTESIPVKQADATWLFLPNLGSHGASLRAAF